jgi:hypothetical protein
MKKVITRKDKLEMLLRAIDLPALVVEVTLDNIKYKPKDYSSLKEIINEELRILNIEVSI